jgi:ferredoxin-NADP reductase
MPETRLARRARARPAGFAATGSGIAPFVSMIQSGARPLALLHGGIFLTEK